MRLQAARPAGSEGCPDPGDGEQQLWLYQGPRAVREQAGFLFVCVCGGGRSGVSAALLVTSGTSTHLFSEGPRYNPWLWNCGCI